MKRVLVVAVVGLSGLVAFVKTGAADLSEENFTKLQALIKPQPGESLWRHIPWETSLTAARQKAAIAGKPLLIWSGGGSAPLGGC